MDRRADFFLNAIQDTQETIRALDQKANSLLVLIALPLPVAAWLLTEVSKTYISHGSVPGWSALGFMCAAAATWTGSIVCLIRAILPRSNPSASVPIHDGASGLWYSGDLFRKRGLFANRVSCRSVQEQLNKCPDSDEKLATELAFEHMKVVFIREVKIAACRWSVYLFVSSLFCLVLAIVVAQLANA